MRTIISRLLYAGLKKEDFWRLMPQARRENEEKLKIYVLVSCAMFSVLLAVSLFARIFPVNTILSFAVMALVSAAIYGLARKLPERHPRATTALCYLFVVALYAFSLVNSALNPDLPAVAAIAIMLMGPFLFSERPIHLIVMNIAAIALLCFLSLRIKSRYLALIDVWNAIAFGVISIAAEITQEKLRFRLLHNTERIRYLSDTDLLTGCKNRNCYQSRLPHFKEQCNKNLVYAYIDVNGLHNLNDSQGHEAGDVMLQTVAHALIKEFGAENTYRIGGDEFAVIRMDAELSEIKNAIAAISADLSAQGYDIAAGVEESGKEDLDLEEISKRAEHSMYQIKKAYYDQGQGSRRE